MIYVCVRLQLGPNVTVGRNVVIHEGVRVKESIILEGAVVQVETIFLRWFFFSEYAKIHFQKTTERIYIIISHTLMVKQSVATPACGSWFTMFCSWAWIAIWEIDFDKVNTASILSWLIMEILLWLSFNGCFCWVSLSDMRQWVSATFTDGLSES